MGSAEERWKRVLNGEFAGTFVTLPPRHSRGKSWRSCYPRARHAHDTRRDLDHHHEICKKHEAKIRRLIRGFVDTIHFFITRKQETLEILKEHASPILHLQSDEEVETLYEEWAHSLERKPYPAIEAIANVFQLAVQAQPGGRELQSTGAVEYSLCARIGR